MTHAAAVKEVSAAAEVGDGAPARWEGDRPGQRPHYQSTVADQGQTRRGAGSLYERDQPAARKSRRRTPKRQSLQRRWRNRQKACC